MKALLIFLFLASSIASAATLQEKEDQCWNNGGTYHEVKDKSGEVFDIVCVYKCADDERLTLTGGCKTHEEILENWKKNVERKEALPPVQKEDDEPIAPAPEKKDPPEPSAAAE